MGVSECSVLQLSQVEYLYPLGCELNSGAMLPIIALLSKRNAWNILKSIETRLVYWSFMIRQQLLFFENFLHGSLQLS